MADELVRSIPRSVWHGWGDPAEMSELSAAAWAVLGERLGVAPWPSPRRPVALAEVRLPDRALPAAALADLQSCVGAAQVRLDRADRVWHAGGKSWPDLHRAWAGDGSTAPDAVVLPADAEEAAAVLGVCARHRIAVVPFGGGTSVVGGVAAGLPPAGGDQAAPYGGIVALDLRRLDRLVACDPVARTATLQAGLRGPDIEAALRPYGLTLGHYPQSHQEATFGGYLATRSAGQASTGYGRPDEHVLGLAVVTPAGVLRIGGQAPRSAAGPRLQELFLGGEGHLGIITEATVRVHRMPTAKRHAAWAFASYDEGAAALRALAQELGPGVIADVCRLSDEEETEVTMAHAGRGGRALLRYLALRGLTRPAVLLLVWEGSSAKALKRRQADCEAMITTLGGRVLPAAVAKAWERHRFAGPYTRDYLMGHAILADTLETATTWDRLPALHAAVGTAIRGALQLDGRRCLVMCHVSHVYPTGASLYYTFVVPESDDPLGQWRAVKAAASEAIVAGGGTITHHHAVGIDHRPYVAAEWGGELGVAVLRAVKATVDPDGILNPGKLIPEPDLDPQPSPERKPKP